MRKSRWECFISRDGTGPLTPKNSAHRAGGSCRGRLGGVLLSGALRQRSMLLASHLVQRAATREHWREAYVGTVDDDGTVLEGCADLIFRDDDGAVVVVDYTRPTPCRRARTPAA